MVGLRSKHLLGQLGPRPILLVLCALLSSLNAQDTSTFFKVLPLPTISYSPETKTAFGAVSLFNIKPYKDSNTRVSNASVEFTYTGNKQIILETDWNYFFNQEKWFTQGLLHYSKYPDLYFGIAKKESDSVETPYTSNRTVIQVNALKQFGNRFFVGPRLRFIQYANLNANSSYFKELQANKTMGFGLESHLDHRSNILTPTKGYYVQSAVDYNISNQNYFRMNLDYRFYKQIKTKFIWSNRFYASHTTKNTPFYDLASAGGDAFVRGFRYGKYRNNSLLTYQTEVRMTIYKSIGFSAFGGISSMDKEVLSSASPVKLNAGLGLRFRVDKTEQTNLRFDYAIGSQNNSGFYVAFGESF